VAPEGRGAELAKKMPEQVLKDTRLISRETTAELRAVLKNPSRREPCPEIDYADLKIHDGYLYSHGRPVFLSISYLKSSDGKIRTNALRKYRQRNDNELGYVFLGHSSVPARV